MKKIVITGATDGIGKISAIEIGKMGYHLILIGRNEGKLKDLRENALKDVSNVDLFTCDLSSVKDTISLGQTLSKKYTELDVLLNNAGAFFSEYQLTPEGIESTFALNHLNYFILANQLLPSLRASKEARIVNVASRAHMGVELEFQNLLGEKKYSGWKQYQRSKLMNIYFTYELAERLKSTHVTVNCLHPGFVKTKFGHNNKGLAKSLVQWGQNLFAISEESGAKTSIYLATSSDVQNVTGKYFSSQKEKKSSDVSYDVSVRQKLWQYTVSLLKEKFNFEVNI